MFSFLVLLEFRQVLKRAAKTGTVLGLLVGDHDGVVPIIPIHVGWATFTYDILNPEDECSWLARSTSALHDILGINYDHIERARVRLMVGEEEGSLGPDEDEEPTPSEEGEPKEA